MNIVAFTDLHASVTHYKKVQAKVKKYKPEAIFCLGDFTIFEQNIEGVLKRINDLGRPVYIIHGNHEQDTMVRRLVKKHKNLTFVHKRIFKLGEYTVVAHGGGGFYGQGKTRGDKDFDAFIKENKEKLKGNLLLLTHAPPAHTKLDYLDWLNDHVGCASYETFLNTHKPVLALSGHIHETFGITYLLGKTILSNPGPDGEVYKL